MKRLIFIFVAIQFLTLSAFGFEDNTFLPENNLSIPVNAKISGGISQAEFNKVIDDVEKVFSSVVEDAGGELKINRKWDDGTVNAYATRKGDTWSISMFGGLARHQTITMDGMYLVVCHELGHHLGGAPKLASNPYSYEDQTWASNEGQSDYYAVTKCLRKVWDSADNASAIKDLQIPKVLQDGCKKAKRNDPKDTALCVRMGMAGKSVSNLFSVLGSLPETKFETPDQNVVSKTDDRHPKAQCRLDTYFQGAMCDSGVNEELSDTDENKGVCSAFNGDRIGNRPACWFKPSR